VSCSRDRNVWDLESNVERIRQLLCSSEICGSHPLIEVCQAAGKTGSRSRRKSQFRAPPTAFAFGQWNKRPTLITISFA